MTRATVSLALAFCVSACALLAGCAAPGDPSPRHPVVPVPVADLAGRQSGSEVVLTFSVPTRSTDRESLAEAPAIEIYRAALPPGATADRKTAWRLVYTVPSERVDSYVKDGHFEFRDPLTPDDLSRTAGSSLAYMVRTRAVKARASDDSNIFTARIYPPPGSPARPARFCHRISDRCELDGIATAIRRISRRLPRVPRRNGIRTRSCAAGSFASEAEIADWNWLGLLLQPILVIRISNLEKRISIRFEAWRNLAPIRWNPLTPRQRSSRRATSFLPPRPVASRLRLSLQPHRPLPTSNYHGRSVPRRTWPAITFTGVTGKDTPGERVNEEILPSPTFRDISVVPGRRYFYRVSAVDRAGNESSKSSAVQTEVP